MTRDIGPKEENGFRGTLSKGTYPVFTLANKKFEGNDGKARKIRPMRRKWVQTEPLAFTSFEKRISQPLVRQIKVGRPTCGKVTYILLFNCSKLPVKNKSNLLIKIVKKVFFFLHFISFYFLLKVDP